MKHFRSLLSLGAIEDDEPGEPYELHRIRSHQPFAKSTRLSQRKRQNKQRLESNTLRVSFTMIDGKKLQLQNSISTKLSSASRRQFIYPNKKRKKSNVELQIEELECEATEIYLSEIGNIEEEDLINFESLDEFSLSLPAPDLNINLTLSKPRLNTTLPPPPPSPRMCVTQSKIQLTQLLPPPSHAQTPLNNPFQLQLQTSVNSTKKYLQFYPENSITSIRSESIPARTSMNSWPSQISQISGQSVTSKCTQIRNMQSLSPIYDYNIEEMPHLSEINDTVHELTDDEEAEIVDIVSMEESDNAYDDDDEALYRPRLATIRSEASMNHMHLNNKDVFMANHIDNTYAYSHSFASSARTSRTITTTTTSATSAYDLSEEEEDVNIAFEYIADNGDDNDSDNGNSQYLSADFACFDFKFMSCIGRGAYGVVDKAFDLSSCHIVAIKRSRSLKEGMLSSFCGEIGILNEFNNGKCPYIINMISYGVDRSKNEICIALEYMNMSSFASFAGADASSLTLWQIGRISFCVLSGLAALHCKLYVHNDVKPDNILFNDAFDVKLTDFGCCQQMRDISTPLTHANGSILFQSFEQKFVSPIRYTTKSDIYSFGITLSCILDNESHINESQPYCIPHNVLSRYGVDEAQLIDFLNKCLHRNYHQRWSAQQLLSHCFVKQVRESETHITAKTGTDSHMDDLEFITDSLIEYYLNYNKQKTQNNVFAIDLNNATPIDDAFTDHQRIQNIAKCTGFSVDAVQEFIFQCVNDVKNQYLKR